MDELHAQGFLVPAIRAKFPNRMILENIGPDLASVIKMIPDESEQRDLAQRALNHLERLHAYGLCHGRPVLQNMTSFDGYQTGMLDLSEDTAAVMPFEAAKGRDYFLFFCSAAQYLDKDSLHFLAGKIDWSDYGVAADQLRRLFRFLFLPAFLLHYCAPLSPRNKVDAVARTVLILRQFVMDHHAHA